jgi:Flp pilus assembly protein TadG
MNARSRFSKGQMLVVFTLVLPVLLGAMGLAADIGVLYFNWAVLQKAADAAALAGAEYLVASPLPTPQSLPSPACASYPGGGNQTADAQSAACTYVTYNGALASEATSISVPASTVPSRVPAGVNTIQVVLDRPNVPVYFLRMLGFSSLRAKAQAIAMAPTPICGAGNGMTPIGVPSLLPGGMKWTDVVPGTTTLTLTEGTNPATSGNWEWINVPGANYQAPSTNTTTTGGGTQQLATNISNGCVNCNVDISDWLTPATGNKGNSNPAATALEARISSTAAGVTIGSCTRNSCSNSGPPADGAGLAADEQFVTLPVVNWSSANGSSSAVQVVGFITAWLRSYAISGGVTDLTIVVMGAPSNTQVTSGNCSPTYPGLTQAELVQ